MIVSFSKAVVPKSVWIHESCGGAVVKISGMIMIIIHRVEDSHFTYNHDKCISVCMHA